MNFILSLFFLLLGWLAGAVINHLADVLPAKERVFQRPFYRGSHITKPPKAWSAITAYLTRSGRCPETGGSIGLRPPVVELVTAILFVFLFNHFGPSVYLLFVLGYTAILALLTVTDLEHRLIQNVVILPAILLALAGAFFTPQFGWKQAILGGAVGFVVFYLLALFARGGLGSGDVTLAAFLGLITAFPQIVVAAVMGMLFGGIVSALLLLTRQVTLKTFIPYGPFLIVAGWMVLIRGEAIMAYLWG